MNVLPLSPIRPRRLPAALLPLALLAAGCADPAKPEVAWGKRGVRDGDLVRPRAIAIDKSECARPLRAGMSAVITIDTGKRRLTRLLEGF